ncbi:hypothetical protein ACFQL7_27595 [Halocatena marina]|uniref:Uncharacterized protein n=1 Tax=Halocatena marina TaxID=2934937 RepID=A0ABD5YV29_9EURY
MSDRGSRRGGHPSHRVNRRRQPPARHPWIERILIVHSYVILAVTCVGQILHEYAHKRACENLNIPIEEICYFQFDVPPGYVSYRTPRYYGHQIGIALAPLFSNTLLAAILFCGVIGGLDHWGLPPLSDDVLGVWIGFVGAGWLGVSCAMHAVPSRDDANLAWTATVDQFPAIGPVCAFPLVVLAYVLSRLDWIGIDYFYTAALVSGVFSLYHSVPLLRTSVRTLLHIVSGL